MVGFIRWKNNSWFGLTSHFEIEAFAARKTRAEINVFSLRSRPLVRDDPFSSVGCRLSSFTTPSQLCLPNTRIRPSPTRAPGVPWIWGYWDLLSKITRIWQEWDNEMIMICSLTSKTSSISSIASWTAKMSQPQLCTWRWLELEDSAPSPHMETASTDLNLNYLWYLCWVSWRHWNSCILYYIITIYNIHSLTFLRFLGLTKQLWSTGMAEVAGAPAFLAQYSGGAIAQLRHFRDLFRNKIVSQSE